ncbi:MAG: hypothetical protein M0Z94_13740 [Dehalococcoidales bacterium]|nr:hypothetical protein [Dehalococcoidales bacterium]
MTTKMLPALIVGVTLGFLSVHTALADEPNSNDFDRNQNWRKLEVQTRVESRPDGVYIQISVHQTVPGTHGSEGSDGARPQLTSGQSSTTGSSSTTSASTTATDSKTNTTSATTPGRSWTDKTGYHWESPTGQVVTATPPNISTATRESWVEQFQQHQDQNPYLLYVDDQFSGIIWVPQSSSSSNVTVVPAPDNSPPPDTVVSGNGGSTDPREVALDALGHVPLPNAQIRVNPALGLVAMPGWFWVEGYDGSSFGTSRTVSVPPEVGPEVPTSVVPANDSRRQGSSFSVEVRIWPTRYEWSFGDGASLVNLSLGKPYPAQSDVQHTYEYSSLRFPSGFPVWLTVDFAAEFRVNGGAPQGLPTIRRTYESGYRVQEVQPVLTSR